MSRRLHLAAATAALLLIVSACSSSGTSTAAPASSAPSAAAPSESAAASESAATSESAAASASAGSAAACEPATETGTVAATIKGFAFSPQPVTAKVGDVVTWTNNDSTGHTVTLKDDAACTTPTIAAGSTGSLKFTAAGTYDYFCKIHPNMTGQITVS